MKKRKPPILAITILLICGAVALGYNYKAGLDPKAQAEQAKEAATEVQVGKPRAGTSSTDVANQVKQQAQGAGATNSPQHPHGPPQGMAAKMGMGGGPSIEIPKQANSKPKPNDTSPSSQWYQPSSSRSGQ